MAIAVRQLLGSTGGGLSTTASVSLTGGTATAAGSMFIVVATSEDEGNTFTVADTAGNSYGSPIISDSASGHHRLYIWKTTAATPSQITSGNVTVTSSASCVPGIAFIEVTGASNATAAEASHINNGSSTSGTSNSSGTPADAGCLVIGAIGYENALNSASSSPAFSPAQTLTNDSDFACGGAFGNFIRLRVSAAVVPTAAAETYTTTIPSSSLWTAGVVLLKAVTATVPDAPTIGTATPAGDMSASVTFTPPGNDGGATITSYTVTCTSSTGGTTRSNSGSASPIVVANLSPGKIYTATVTATNSVGTSAASSASNAFTVPFFIRVGRNPQAVRRSTLW